MFLCVCSNLAILRRDHGTLRIFFGQDLDTKEIPWFVNIKSEFSKLKSAKQINAQINEKSSSEDIAAQVNEGFNID